jgi:broad specificity phosphatase PhoE
MVAHVYLSHPQVRVDPDVPVPEWGLSDDGRMRLTKALTAPWFQRFKRIVSSTETKAMETARMVAARTGLLAEVRGGLHENDRSATGYLPPEDFEKAADAFFQNPDDSFMGWETARDAQARIVRAVAGVIGEKPDSPTLFVGHGAVGTLLWCYLSRRGISRWFDQKPGGGCHFGFDFRLRTAFYAWQPIENPPRNPP